MTMISVLTIALWIVAALAALPLAVFTLEMLLGLWPSRTHNSATAPNPSVAVLMPAHNEAAGIANTLAKLKAAAPADTRVVVVADNCSDDTAKIARDCGVEVIERSHETERGKGYALAFGRDHLAQQASPPDVVIVLDADCELHGGSVEALAAEAQTRAVPVQAVNLISGDLTAPPMVQVSSFAMVVKNLFRSRGMQRLGGAALLTGTGMAFPWAIFSKAKLATGNIVEDLGLGIELTRTGKPPRLIGHAHVRSAPADMRDALTQRTRWEHGFLQTVRTHALPTFLGGIRRFSLAEILLGLHLMVPPLALLVMLSGLVFAALSCAAWLTAIIGPAALLGGVLSTALVLILIGWIVNGREFLSGGALLRMPLYVLWKIPVYLGFLKGPEANWKRTERRP